MELYDDHVWHRPIPGYPEPFDPWANCGDCTFHPETARWVINYWQSTFTLKDGDFDGKPFILEDWQWPIIGHLFGWKRPDGSRRFRKCFIYLPKKNGKTEMGAGIGLLMLDVDNEMQAEVFSCASDTDQARIVFSAADLMVERSKKLRDRIMVRKSTRRMLCTRNGGSWKVLSSKAETKHGPNVHLLLIDELHTQKDNELITTLEAGTVSRRQPLVVAMTTSDHPGESPCNLELMYAKRVLSGETKDISYLPVIYDGQPDYEKDKECWKSMDFLKKVNPNFGISVQEAYLQTEINKCEVDPTHEEWVKRLHANIQTNRVTRWLDPVDWQLCGENDTEHDGPCFGGLDLGSSDDLTALALYWPKTQSCKVWHFVPQETYDAKAEYILWKSQKAMLTVTAGRVLDQGLVREMVNTLKDQYDIQCVGYDRWNATGLITDLADEDGVTMVEMGQGYQSLSMPTNEFGKLVKSHQLCHDNDPVLNWEAGNVTIQAGPAGAIKPVKPKPWSPLKVDGMQALIIAYAMSLTQETEEDQECAIVLI